MRLARTHGWKVLGRLGSLPGIHRGGGDAIRGSGEVSRRQQVTGYSGRLGSLGRLILAHTCARPIPGVWGVGCQWYGKGWVPHKAREHPPQTPQPPRRHRNLLIRRGNSLRDMIPSTSLLSNLILPNLPFRKEGDQPIGLNIGQATKSSERALS